MRILITGGAGYKGTVLCHLLRQTVMNLERIDVVDTLRWGARSFVHLLVDPKIVLHRLDIRATTALVPLLTKADVIVNLAAIVGHPECARFPMEAQQVNTDAVENMIRVLSRQQKYVQASTGSVYGKLDTLCGEDSPTNPLTVYGKTKLNAEKFVLDHGGVCLRFATAYGVSPCMRFDVLPHFFVWRAISEGSIVAYETNARRTLIDVRDMARSYDLTIQNYAAMSGQVYNVGDEKLNVTKQQVLDIVHEMFPNVPIFGGAGQDADGRDYNVRYEKIKTACGFEATVDLRKSMGEVRKVAESVVASELNPWRFC